MISQVFTHVLRNRKKYLYNIFLLAFGISIILVISNYLRYQKSYDKFYENTENLYRFTVEQYAGGVMTETRAYGPAPIVYFLKYECPEVEKCCRIKENMTIVLDVDKKKKIRENTYIVDPSFLDIFDIPLLKGNKNEVLKNPGNIIISKSFARKLFGLTNPVDKQIFIGDSNWGTELYTVKGVFDDYPMNSHFRPNVLISLGENGNDFHDRWYDDFRIYVSLRPGTDKKIIEKRINNFYDESIKFFFNKLLTTGEFRKEYTLQPIDEIFLNSNHFNWENDKRGDYRLVKILIVFVGFILLMININFFNVFLTHHYNRLKEYGIKRVCGLEGLEMFSMSVVLSAFICLASFSISLIFLYILTKIDFLIIDMSYLELITQPAFWKLFVLMLLGFIISTGLLPGLVISRYSAVKIISKSSNNNNHINSNGFLILQTIVVIVLISGSLTINNQVNTILKKDIGMNLDDIVVLHHPVVSFKKTNYNNKVENFINKLSKYPVFKQTTNTIDIPGHSFESLCGIRRTEGITIEQQMKRTWIDENYLSTFKIKLAAGRNFLFKERNSIIINREALERLGYTNPEEILNTDLEIFIPEKKTYKVIGVTESFDHFPNKKTSPLIFHYHNEGRAVYGYIACKVKEDKMGEAKKIIQKEWDLFFPNSPLEYFFSKEYYESKIKSVKQFQSCFHGLTILVFLFAFIGFSDLFAYNLKKRFKEIGIRKVLGSSLFQLFTMLAKKYVLIILLTIAVISPINHILFQKWLQNFVFKSDIGVGFYLFPTLIMVGVVLLVIGLQLFRLNTNNAIEALKED